MFGAFHGCTNLTADATDEPVLWNTNSMANMFNGATSFNSDINGWDVSSIDNMIQVFAGATSFNQPLNSWDVGSVGS